MESPTKSRKLVVEGGECIVDFDNKAFKPIPQAGIDLAVESDVTDIRPDETSSAMFIALNIADVQPGD